MNETMKKLVFVLVFFYFFNAAYAQVYVRYRGTSAAIFADSVLHYYNRVDSTEYTLSHPVLELKAGNPGMGRIILVLLHKGKHIPYAFLFIPVGSDPLAVKYVLVRLDEFNHNSMTPVITESVFTADADLDGDNEIFIITSEGSKTKRSYSTIVFGQDEDITGYLASFSEMTGVDLEGDSFSFDFGGCETAEKVKEKLKADQKKHWMTR
jgi:hypothetical protein